MKLNRNNIIAFTVFLALSLTVCCTHYPMIHEPDMKEFNDLFISAALLDSLESGILIPGMPYSVVEQIFQEWPSSMKEIKIPVASIGSKQRLREVEGWGRRYVDLTIQIFLDKYKTKNGKLYVWYQLPDFYRMDVSMGDTLCVFLEDTVYCSSINYLRKSRTLAVKDTLFQIPENQKLYGEVRYHDQPRRKTTHWYTLQILSDGQHFIIKDLQYEIYPIEKLEVDGEPVSSFNWR